MTWADKDDCDLISSGTGKCGCDGCEYEFQPVFCIQRRTMASDDFRQWMLSNNGRCLMNLHDIVVDVKEMNTVERSELLFYLLGCADSNRTFRKEFVDIIGVKYDEVGEL